VQFRAELFNVFNNTSFARFDNNLASATFGTYGGTEYHAASDSTRSEAHLVSSAYMGSRLRLPHDCDPLLEPGEKQLPMGKLPSLDKEGCLRPLIKCREASLPGADGVVRSSHRLIRKLNEPPRPRLSKDRGHFLMARPPLLSSPVDTSIAR
jgi:hypothetical protein